MNLARGGAATPNAGKNPEKANNSKTKGFVNKNGKILADLNTPNPTAIVMPSWRKEKEKAGVRGAAPAPSPSGAGKPSAPTAGMSRDFPVSIFGGVVADERAAVF
jgi:hypothetical protein